MIVIPTIDVQGGGCVRPGAGRVRAADRLRGRSRRTWLARFIDEGAPRCTSSTSMPRAGIPASRERGDGRRESSTSAWRRGARSRSAVVYGASRSRCAGSRAARRSWSSGASPRASRSSRRRSALPPTAGCSSGSTSVPVSSRVQGWTEDGLAATELLRRWRRWRGGGPRLHRYDPRRNAQRAEPRRPPDLPRPLRRAGDRCRAASGASRTSPRAQLRVRPACSSVAPCTRAGLISRQRRRSQPRYESGSLDDTEFHVDSGLMNIPASRRASHLAWLAAGLAVIGAGHRAVVRRPARQHRGRSPSSPPRTSTATSPRRSAGRTSRSPRSRATRTPTRTRTR